ncbi:MAG TPA: type II toxin-antitoxin system HicB family antitoxin [Caulobacteraceae bacterium]|jgi:predicted RNase H-like HicB family nuclease
MPQRFYPAVLERGEGGAIAVWFPDFPGYVAGAMSEEEAMARASDTLEDAMKGWAEVDALLPQPTPLKLIETPPGSEIIAIIAVGASPPDPSERVNVYLPKSLIERVDRLAAELGMNRSSFFGMAASEMIKRHAGRTGTFGPMGR